MFTGTLAANAPFAKQKKYPKVRGGKNAKDVNNEETVTFGYEPLTSLDDQDVYYDEDEDIHCRSEDDILKNQSRNVKSTGSDYIKKLLQEEEFSRQEHANAELSPKKECTDTRKRSKQEDEKNKVPHKVEESHQRTLMKEKSHLELEFSKGRERSRSSSDVSSSFLANVLKDSLFVAQFTVPEAENDTYSLKRPSLIEPTIHNEHLTQRNATPKFRMSHSFSRAPLKAESKEKITTKGKGKANLVRGLENSIFQPSLFVQNKGQLTASCPNLAQPPKGPNKGPPPPILARALNPSRMANVMTSRSNKEPLGQGRNCCHSHDEKEPNWEKVETITRERPNSNLLAPAVGSLVQEALRNSWFAINMQSRNLSACSSADITTHATAAEQQPERIACVFPCTSSGFTKSFSMKNTSGNDMCNTSELASQHRCTELPTFVIDTPKTEKDDFDDKKKVTTQEDKEPTEECIKHQQYFDDIFATGLCASSHYLDDKDGIDSPSNSSRGSPSIASLNLREGCNSKDDQTKSIMDVLDILCSIQGETEFSFFEDKCCASGTGLTEGFVDEPAIFHLVLMDKPDLLHLMVIIDGPGILQPRTEYTSLTKNIIRVVYWPERVGRYTIRILWKNREIPGSPFKPLVLLPKCEVWVKRVL